MKTQLILAPWALVLASGCGPAPSSQDATPGPEAGPDPALPELSTPAEEAARATQAITEANAEAELERLEAELAGG